VFNLKERTKNYAEKKNQAPLVFGAVFAIYFTAALDFQDTASV